MIGNTASLHPSQLLQKMLEPLYFTEELKLKQFAVFFLKRPNILGN